MTRINFDCPEPLRVRQWVIEDIGIRDEPCVAVTEILFGFAGQTAIGCPTVAQLTLFPRWSCPIWITAWEQRKLNECLTVSSEKNSNGAFKRNDVLSVSKDFGVINQIAFQGRSFAGADLSNYGVLNHGEIVYTKSPLKDNPFGIIKSNKSRSGIVSTLYAIYRPLDGTLANFIDCYFSQDARVNNYLHPLISKGAKNDMKVSAENALKGTISIPSVAEQKMICELLAQLDSLITLHQRKCQYRGLYGYLSWEQRKFSDVAVIRRGLTYSPTNIVDGADGVRVLRSANINEDHFVLNDDDVFVDEGAVNIDLVHDGDILITAANGSPRLFGKRARISDLPGKTVHGGFMLVASSPYSDFLCASMGSSWYRRFLATGVAGGNGAIGNLDSKALGETTIAVPNDAEIDKLGNFFTRLDSLITLHQ